MRKVSLGVGCAVWRAMMCFCLGSAAAARAAEYTWQGGDGAFSDSLKWSPEGVPGLEDTATFSSPTAEGRVSFTASATNSLMVAGTLNGNTLALDLCGYAYTLTNRVYFDGSQSSTYLTVSNGVFTVPTNSLDVKIGSSYAPARLTFGDGVVATLDRLHTYRSDIRVEPGAALTCNNEVKIGDGAANTVSALSVRGGALTLNHNLWMNGGNNSTSTLDISGGAVVAKKYFSIGNGGGGTGWGVLNLSGGYLETQSDVWLGNAASARGVANISGGLWVPKSQFELPHGSYTVAWLNMTGGEIFMPTSGKAFIVANGGNGHMSTGTLALTGGRITVTNNASFNVCSASNSLGQVFVGGAAELWARDFKVGVYRDGRGECVVTGGLLRVFNYLGVGSAAGSAGAVLVDGGEVFAQNSVQVGDTSTGVGSFTLSNGVVRSAGKFHAGYNGTGTVHVAGGMLVVSNDFAVGSNWPGWGDVLMTGGGLLCSNSVKVGDWGGSGVFDLRGGTVWAQSSVIVGNGNGSTGTLILTGGRIATPQNVTVANNAQKGAWGELYVRGGELISSNTLILGSSLTNWGRAVVAGGVIEANAVTVGGSGSGEWQQSNGTVTARGNLLVANTATSSGTFSLAGGELTCRGTVSVAVYGAGSLSVSGGLFTVSNALNCADATNSAGALTLSGGAVAAKGGSWGSRGVASVLISGGTNTFSGNVSVGIYSQAVLTVSGGSNSFPSLYVARNNSGSSAIMTVSGGQTTVADYLDIGQFGRGVLEVAGGEITTKILRMNPGTATTPVPPQSEIRVTGGRLQVNSECYMPDTASITGRLVLAGGVFAVPAVRQHHGRLHVLFDGGTVEAVKSDSAFIRALDAFALTGRGLVVDSAGFAIGTSLALPDAEGERGRLVKKGAGVFTLFAANTFSGPVVVEGGELALGPSGLITLAGGCEVDGGALLNLSARTLDFTVPAGTVSRVDGELRLAAGKTLTVASGATLGGTGVVGRVVFEPGAVLLRDAADGSALLFAAECAVPAGAVVALSGFSAADLRAGIPLLSGGALSAASGETVTVLLDGVPQAHSALSVSGGVLRVFSYEPGTLLRVF